MSRKPLLLQALILLLSIACYAGSLPPHHAGPLSEDFEGMAKTSYAAANVALRSGSWYFNNALLGGLPSDRKEGAHSVRIRNTGSIRMNFDYPYGASTITIKHAVYGSDGAGAWELQVSTDGGNTYTRIGSSFTSSSPALQTATIPVNIAGNIRIAIVKTDGNATRINIDDVEINAYAGSTGDVNTGAAADGDNMLLGNPSHATADTDNYDNYLMVKAWYTLSYNRDRGTPNWVSWHVQASDLDTIKRGNDFRPDESLPVSWYHAGKNSYNGSGFDRGHNCPSADRTASIEANSATFLMTNMMPQAPRNNEQTWANLESYERSLVRQGNEVYIVAGSYGTGGTGKKGTRNSLDNGHIAVPSYTWKVIVILPDGTNDLSRINTTTRVIAVVMPNVNTIDINWKKYRSSVRTIETATGYDLLSNVPAGVQEILEAKIDHE